MKFVTSFNTGIYRFHARWLLESLLEKEPGCNVVAYHEETVEKEKLNKRERLSEVEYLDLFKDNREYLQIIKNKKMFPTVEELVSRDLSENDISLNMQARFFCRKVLSIRDAMRNTEDEDVLIWIDADCYIKTDFSSKIKAFKDYDIAFVNRESEKKYSDTYFILFNIANKRVREFIEDWYQLYNSREVYDLNCWADHATFDYIRGKYDDLNYLNIKDSRKLNSIVRHKTGHKFNWKLRPNSTKAIYKELNDLHRITEHYYKEIEACEKRKEILTKTLFGSDVYRAEYEYGILMNEAIYLEKLLNTIKNNINKYKDLMEKD